MWKDRCKKLHDPNNTSSPTAGLDAEIAHCYANPQDILAADRQLLNRPIPKVLKFKRSTKTKFLRGIRIKPTYSFLAFGPLLAMPREENASPLVMANDA
jgi:hypothetical protein